MSLSSLRASSLRYLPALAVTFLLAGSVHAQLFGGNLLPNQNPAPAASGANDLPKTNQQIQSTVGAAQANRIVRKYVSGAAAGPQNFNSNVFCDGILVGTLTFQYAAYTGEFAAGDALNSSGGMVIRGGFKLAPNVSLAPGVTLRWIQSFRETTGATSTSVMDVGAGQTDPFYPNHTLAGFDALLFDIPRDSFTNPAAPDNLRFESSLVCYSAAQPKALHSFGSFQWFYDIDKVGNTIKNEGVTGFSAPLGQILTQPFNTQFGPTGTNNAGWTLDSNCIGCVSVAPEPNSFALLWWVAAGSYGGGSVGALGIIVRSRLRRRSSVAV